MSHHIRAVVGHHAVIEHAARALDARWVALDHGVALLPMTDELFARLSVGAPSDEPFETFNASVLARLREHLPAFGYIETEYWGGTGVQRAGAWAADDVLVAPVEGPADAVNAVLRWLGVRAGDARDEWDAVGLVRFRGMDDLEAATRGTAPPRLG